MEAQAQSACASLPNLLQACEEAGLAEAQLASVGVQRPQASLSFQQENSSSMEILLTGPGWVDAFRFGLKEAADKP